MTVTVVALIATFMLWVVVVVVTTRMDHKHNIPPGIIEPHPIKRTEVGKLWIYIHPDIDSESSEKIREILKEQDDQDL